MRRTVRRAVISVIVAVGLVGPVSKSSAQAPQTLQQLIEGARKEGWVHTLLGRRRRVLAINSKSRADREAAERNAINTPMQGTAADLIKLAMLRVAARMADEHPDVALILQVHDELLLECPSSKAREVAEVVKREMEGAYPLDVPLVAELHSGKTWDEAH